MKSDTSNMIKNLRKSRNLTQEQFGVLSGMTKSQISRMEKGVLGSPETVDRLLEAMGYAIEVKVVDRYETPDGERQRILDTLGNFKKHNAGKYGIESLAQTVAQRKVREYTTAPYQRSYPQTTSQES